MHKVSAYSGRANKVKEADFYSQIVLMPVTDQLFATSPFQKKNCLLPGNVNHCASWSLRNVKSAQGVGEWSSLFCTTPRAWGWVTSTPMTRKPLAKGAGGANKGRSFRIECFSLAHSGVMPSTRLLGGRMLRLLIKHFRPFERKHLRDFFFLLLYFIYIGIICAKTWLPGNSWGRQQHCTKGGSRPSPEMFLKGFIKGF